MENKNIPELEFRPLTSGLGFHPFSNGLPYAPVTKAPVAQKKIRSGTGATVAGPPVFTKNLPKISVPVAQLPSSSQPAQEFESSLVLPTSFGFGYLFARILAYVIDSSINLVVCGIALGVVLRKQNISPELLLSPGIAAMLAVFLFVFNWALIAAQEIAFGTSVGKRMLGLGLKGSTSAVFLRSFFFLFSTGFFGLGLIGALFSPAKRCWHDSALNLQPTECQ